MYIIFRFLTPLIGLGASSVTHRPTPGASSKNRGAMALRLELGEGLLGIEVPGSGFCAQDFWDFLWIFHPTQRRFLSKVDGFFIVFCWDIC